MIKKSKIIYDKIIVKYIVEGLTVLITSLAAYLSRVTPFISELPALFRIALVCSFSLLMYAIWKLYMRTESKRLLVDNSGLFYFKLNSNIKEKEDNRKLLENKYLGARDISIIGATGYHTFAKSDVNDKAMLRECLEKIMGEIKILLLLPEAKQTKMRATALGVVLDKYQKEIYKSIAFIKDLKSKGKNISLKFYLQRPVWKIIILDDFMWLQYYHHQKHVQEMPVYGIRRDNKNIPYNLYDPLYDVFQKKWVHDHNPVFDFDSDEIVHQVGFENFKAGQKMKISEKLKSATL